MIDDHVHPFPLDFTPLVPAAITLDVNPDSGGDDRRRALAPGRLALHLMQRRLANLLGVGLSDVVAARDATAQADWTAWVRHLFDDAGITGMIVDEAVGPVQPSAPPDRFADLAGRPVWAMARIDPLVDHLIDDGADAAGIVGEVEAFMDRSVAEGAVAFKTILAYRTGLRVDPDADLGRAQRSLDSDAADGLPTRRRGKLLRDLVMRTVLARCRDLDRPLQIHTGFGDSQLRLAESDPLLLDEILRTPEGSAAAVVLIHGSFPWHQHAAYLASTKPNLWIELSLSNLFAPVGVADRLLEILDVAPAGRVLLGSDGHGNPETHWFGCRILREAWETAAGHLGSMGAEASWLEGVRDAIFERNARAVYPLG